MLNRQGVFFAENKKHILRHVHRAQLPADHAPDAVFLPSILLIMRRYSSLICEIKKPPTMNQSVSGSLRKAKR